MRKVLVWKDHIRMLIERFHGTDENKKEFESILYKHQQLTDPVSLRAKLEPFIATLKMRIGVLRGVIAKQLKPSLLMQLADLLWVCGSLCAISDIFDENFFSEFEKISEFLDSHMDLTTGKLVYVKIHLAMLPVFICVEPQMLQEALWPALISLRELREMTQNKAPNPEKDALLKWMNFTEEDFVSAVSLECLYGFQVDIHFMWNCNRQQIESVLFGALHSIVMDRGLDTCSSIWLFQAIELSESYHLIGHFYQSYYLLTTAIRVLNEYKEKYTREELDWMKRRINLCFVQHTINQLTFDDTYPDNTFINVLAGYSDNIVINRLYVDPAKNFTMEHFTILKDEMETYLRDGKDIIDNDESLADLESQWIEVKQNMISSLSLASESTT